MILLRKEIIIAGRGGQGILLLGHVMGVAAAKFSEYYVTGTESYSAETRGGDSKAEIIIADSAEELGYMKVRRADIAVFMYGEQLVKYSSLVSPNAVVFADSTFITEVVRKDWVLKLAPYTKIAETELGTPRVANMVALGHLIGVTKLLSTEAVERAIEYVVKKSWIKLNKKAFRRGLRVANE